MFKLRLNIKYSFTQRIRLGNDWLINLVAIAIFLKARIKRRTSHERHRMQMRKTLCSPSLAFDLAHVKCEVLT